MNIAAYPTHELTSTTQVAHLPVIPSHWEVRRVKYASNLKSEKIASKGCDLPYIGMENVQSWSGNLLEGGSEVEGLATTFEAGDILFGKLRPYLAKVVKPGFSGICSSEFLVFQSAKDTFGDFLAYALRSSDFISLINGSTYGAKMPRANPDFIANAEIPFPPLPEQRAIAAFLDNKSAKIDQAVRIKEAQIKLLRERRQILIQQAVTRGLNPDAPMKDSGIDWIGEIPAHWKVKPFTKFCENVVDYRGKTPDKVEEGILLVTAKNVREGFLDYKLSREYIKPSDYEMVMSRGKPKCGDILFTTEAPLGNFAIVDDESVALAQRIIKFRLKKQIMPEFVNYFLNSFGFQNNLATMGTGSTATGIKASKLNQLLVIIPPVEEQAVIAEHLIQSSNKINAGISIKEKQISALKEYKTTLINAAVTGKIKVS